MRRALALILSLVIGQESPGVGGTQDLKAELLAGIQQIDEGHLQDAVITLDAVITRMKATPAAAADLTQALVYKGVALVGLAQEEPAKAAFREALQINPELRLSRDQFSPRVMRIFEAAREGKEKSVLMPPSNTAKKAGLSGVAIASIIGGVALTGAGAALATGGSPQQASAPGTATISTSPTGLGIAGVTPLTFTATTNLTGATFTWNFGDGTSGSGQTVTHVYATEGAFTVSLNVTSGAASASATATVSARFLDGLWYGTVGSESFFGSRVSGFYLVQSGAILNGQWSYFNVGGLPGQYGAIARGSISPPRSVVFSAEGYGVTGGVQRPPYPRTGWQLSGTLDSTLTRMTGTAIPLDGFDRLTGEQSAFDLRR